MVRPKRFELLTPWFVASYVGIDGSKWSIKQSDSISYKYNYITDIESETYSSRIISLSSSDKSGNTINYSGNYTYNNATYEYSGYMTSIEQCTNYAKTIY